MNASQYELAQATGQMLEQRNLKLVTVESCTGGGVASLVTEIPGSSNWFDCAFVTYSNEAKVSLVGVNRESINYFGAVSRQVAIEMAKGGLRYSGADVAISVTGIAGPDGGSVEKPVGTVWMAWADRTGKLLTKGFLFGGDRNQVRQSTVDSALQELREFIQQVD